MTTNAEKSRKVQLERAEKFIARGDQWSDINLHAHLYKKRDAQAVSLSYWSVPNPNPRQTDRVTFEEASVQHYTPTTVGELEFGPSWSTHWFKVHIKVPEDWKGEQVNFIWDSEGEALIWKDNMPIQAFLGSSGDDRRDSFVLTKCANGGDEFDFFVEMSVNGMFGLGTPFFLSPPPADRKMKVRIAEIGLVDKKAVELYHDLEIILGIAKELDENDVRAWQAYETVRKIVNVVHADDRSTYEEGLKIAKEFLSKKNGDLTHQVTAIGHCHIDTAWLWPYSETRRKVARSWATQCSLMADYPEYKFTASQAQQYEWMKERYPKLYEKMKEYISKGQFIPIGGTWVEMDCNVPSGESFVRQFLLGQAFFEKEFGKRCDVFWLPDTFGYSCQLPQVMKECDIKYFLTQKLSWNLINKFPHNTFIWEGLDGTRVPCHFPPADTYCSHANVKDVLYGTKNFKTKDKSNQSMLVFGYGDGGGGPDRGMLERLRRLRDVDGVPRVEMKSPSEFFDSLVKNSSELPIWVGELYFELHRGTYTTQAKNKLGNRKSEFLMTKVEFLASLALLLGKYKYPQDEITRLWKLILLYADLLFTPTMQLKRLLIIGNSNQFHDVLPGTSIGLVYEDTDEIYAEIERAGAHLAAAAMNNLIGDTQQNSSHVALINTLCWDRVAVVELPEGIKAADNAQKSASGNYLGVVSAKSLSVNAQAPVTFHVDKYASITETDDEIIMQNSTIIARFNKRGELVSLLHKPTNRESIDPNGKGNKFVLFEDVPLYWDAWDVEFYHTEKPCHVDGSSSIEITERGPLRVAFKLSYRISAQSSLVQNVYLDALSDIITFDTVVDWHENRKILKVEFPLNVYTVNASYSTHFGWLSRPTHRNTTWDLAKFEVCGHHWADLSEYGFGVALLNDCKYGYSALGNVLYLSLLRSAKMPDANADMGVQKFRYGLFPHVGSHTDANLARVGYEFNSPLYVAPAGRGGSIGTSQGISLFSVDARNIILETVKKAEKDDGIVIRLWESCGGRGTANITSYLPVAYALRCNALEDEKRAIPVTNDGHTLSISFKPFEILTIKLKFQSH